MARRLREDRVRHEQELARLQKAWLAVVDCFQGPALIVDTEGMVQAANRSAATQWGLKSVGGRQTGIWRPPDQIRSPLHNALQLGQAHLPEDFQQVVPLIFREQERSFLPRIVPLFGEDQIPIGAIIVFDDVTRFRLLDEMHGDFVAAVSHESKTPLTSIRLAIYLLLQETVGQLNPRQMELLIDARDNTERLLDMIDKLLNHSIQLQHERIHCPVRLVTGNEILESVAAAIRDVARKNETDLVLEAHASGSTIRVHVEQVVNAVQRLLEHNLRLQERAGQITFRAEQTQDFVTLSIKDSIRSNGAATNLDGFFHFAHAKPAKQTKGFLEIMAETIRAQGGDLVILDEHPGHGTLFQLRFPVHSAASSSIGSRAELARQR
jgi:two-component system, NtrC family, sensor histidine kinase KinB